MRAARSGAEIPMRSPVATCEPAEVPTTTSACRGSHPVPSSSAESTPAWNARPPKPPAPRTSPILLIPTAFVPRVDADVTESALGNRPVQTRERHLRRALDHVALDVVPRAVARTVPGPLGVVPTHRAPHVGALRDEHVGGPVLVPVRREPAAAFEHARPLA